VRNIYHVEDSPMVSHSGRPDKTIGQINKRDLEINGLSFHLIHDKTFGVLQSMLLIPT